MFFTFFAATPAVTHFVNDHAHVLSEPTTQKLEKKLQELNTKDSSQVIILTISQLENETIEDFAHRIFNHYKIGQKNKDNGVLICLSKNDRTIRIEVGRGLEGKLTDLTSGRIIREYMRPYLKKNAYDQGIEAGVNAVIQVIQGEFKSDEKDLVNPITVLMIIIIFISIWILFFVIRNKGPRRPSRSGGYYWYTGHTSSSNNWEGFSGGFSGGGGSSSGGGASGKF